MTLTITDQIMRSPDTPHAAYPYPPVENGDWYVTFLPGSALTRDQAIAAMSIAELVGHIPAGAGPEAYSPKFWALVDTWAAELGLSGRDAVARASEPPQEQ